MDAQGNLCMICEEPESAIDHKTGTKRALSVDHCHTTGQVRDLLCWRCNSIIGQVEEKPERLLAMVDYLNRWRKPAL